MRKFLTYVPLVCLIGAVVIAYFKLPLDWFLVSTGLLALAFVLMQEKPVKKEVISASAQTGTDKILDALGDAAFIYDPNFRVLAWNAAAENIFHIQKNEIMGKVIEPKDASTPSWQRLVQVVFPSLAPQIIPVSKEGEFPQITDLTFTDPELVLRVTASKIVLDPATGASGFLKIVQDRTSESEAVKEKTDFVTVASHQLRTPTTSILWAMESLLRSEHLQGEDKEFAQNAYDSAKKLSTIVEDLLSISRIEEGKFGYNFAPMDIVAFLAKTLQEALPEAKRLGVKIFFDRPQAQLPPVYADESKLSIALGNILDNAVRYNVKDGEITVRVKQGEGQFVEVDVRDTGIGIPKEEINRLFKKFYRASNALKFETTGSGLGLYIAQGIIQAHGGRVGVESEVDHGTVVSFTLPTDPSLIPPKETPLQ